MTPREYEDYVGRVVSQIGVLRSARLSRNRRFKGVRQAGEYEVDIALEIRLKGKPFFVLIIECKNWKRPVDRPVIQRIAQTRDAIAASKAAVVSPMGFTCQAVAVAKSLDVALWVISKRHHLLIAAMLAPWFDTYWWLRYLFLRSVIEGEDNIHYKSGHDLISYERTERTRSKRILNRFAHTVFHDLGEDTAFSQIAASVVQSGRLRTDWPHSEIGRKVTAWSRKARRDLTIPEGAFSGVLDAVIAGDPKVFKSAAGVKVEG